MTLGIIFPKPRFNVGVEEQNKLSLNMLYSIHTLCSGYILGHKAG